MFESLYPLYNCKNIYGPYIGDDGRKRCVIYFNDGSTSSRSYSKLLMEEKLNRLLMDDEEVDHKDNDKTNDDINNLQLLTGEENKAKHYIAKVKDTIELYHLVCAWCNTDFILDKSTLTTKIRQSRTGLAFCQRKCSIEYGIANGLSNYKSSPHRTDETKIKQIQDLKKKDPSLSNRKIAAIVGVSNFIVSTYLRNK